MPDVLIEVAGSWLSKRKPELLDAIYASLVQVLQIRATEKLLRLIEHPLENFLIPAGVSEKFIRLEITMFSGRTRDTKRSLYRAIVERLAAFGIPSEDIKIVLIEVPAENVGIRGGQAACDVDLGYEIQL